MNVQEYQSIVTDYNEKLGESNEWAIKAKPIEERQIAALSRGEKLKLNAEEAAIVSGANKAMNDLLPALEKMKQALNEPFLTA